MRPRSAATRLRCAVITTSAGRAKNVEATTGIEPVYAVLQTAPWPLGHVATEVFGWLPREDSNLG